MKRVYLAAPFGTPDSEKRENALTAKRILELNDFEVFCPWEYQIPHAWDYPNTEWGQMVFTNDVTAIKQCDMLVMLSYGRESTAGTNWEAGFAYGLDKIVLVVEMTDEIMSLMVANGRYATVKGLNGLADYDFESMPKTRTETEQK